MDKMQVVFVFFGVGVFLGSVGVILKLVVTCYQLERQVTLYENNDQNNERTKEKFRELSHDMKNHMMMIQGFAQRGDCSSIIAYLSSVSEYLCVDNCFVDTGNQAFDMIVNLRMDKAVKMGCIIETRVCIPKDLGMPAFDMNVLFGNLLDNAIEALERVDDKVLDFRVCYEKGMLMICLQNAYDGVWIENHQGVQSRKADRLNHGIGCRNIKKIIKKYGGFQTVRKNDRRFQTNIIIYL